MLKNSKGKPDEKLMAIALGLVGVFGNYTEAYRYSFIDWI